jgi:hypothetical protein
MEARAARRSPCASLTLAAPRHPERLAAAGIIFLDPVRGVQAIVRLAAQGGRPRASPRAQEPGTVTAFDGGRVPDPPGHLVVPEVAIASSRRRTVVAAPGGQDAPAAVAAQRWLRWSEASARASPRAAAALVVDLRTAGGHAPGVTSGSRSRIGAALDSVYVRRCTGAARAPARGVPRSDVRGHFLLQRGGLTGLIDDVVTERAPIDPRLAASMVERLRIRRHARDEQGPLPAESVAAFLARFSELALTAPWRRFVFEVNPAKWTRDAVVAVDGLLIIDTD